jgi:NAD(P)-dependent dehydrogenase (short-subunit alcohol dehydrogenase family)
VSAAKTFAGRASLSGRVALVTGAGGHVGRRIAAVLTELGAKVAGVDRDAASLDGAPISGSPIVADLANAAGCAAAVELALVAFGRIDVLVNNAAFVGTSALDGWAVPFERQGASAWNMALDVNLSAAFHLAQAAAPALRNGGHGAIVNIASIYGMVGPDWSLYDGTPLANPAAYAASKGGLLQLTRWLSTTLGPDIRVNAVSPGGIERAGQPESFVARYVARTPLRRMANEQDVADAVAYLAGDLAAYVTGQNIAVDGGWTAW